MIDRFILIGGVGVMGLLVGSFLNVCIFRLPRDCMSIVRPRSRCTGCLMLIRWFDNIPVLSWLLLGGRCRGCRTPISVRYPAIELVTGGLFLYCASAGLPEVGPPGGLEAARLAVTLAVLSSLVVCSMVDLDFQIIPDEITLWGLGLGLALGAAFPEWHAARGVLAQPPDPAHPWPPMLLGLATSAVGAAVGAGVLWVVGVVGSFVFRKEAMGLGDVKLLGYLGAVLGWQDILMTVVVASFVGSAVGLVRLLFVRGSQIPFGPFLSIGAAVLLLFRADVYARLMAINEWLVGVARRFME